MKFRFKVQQYQSDAVTSIVNVFNGQPYQNLATYSRDLGQIKIGSTESINLFNEDYEIKDFDKNDIDIGFSNSTIKLSNEKLLENIRLIQSNANIKQSNSLYNTNGLGKVSLDVEMETGTGKTYVYIKTMFELHKRFGWSKFIVIVPSIAIREGVKKSFEMTQEHLMDLYGEKARCFIYNSSRLNDLDTFSSNNKINVMIINTQAFNARGQDARRIYESLDEFQSRRPIDVIAKNRPIIIMDEPQKMSGEATQESLKNFNPLFVMNYSATHRIQHNLVYVLDALDAYNQKIVKRIEVKGFTIKNLRGTNGYLYLQKIEVKANKPPRALIEIEITYNKSINRETRFFDIRDDLYETSNRLEQYKNGFMISEINPINSTVTFTNGEVIKQGAAIGDVSEIDIRRIQIRETIISHFQKEKEMFEKEIKVLSLFFIDEVAKYRIYDEEGIQQIGIYGKIFEEEYVRELNNYLSLLDTNYAKYLQSIEIDKTHKGYFSIDKKTKHFINPITKKNSDDSDDISAYDLILKDKERLLSFDEPTRFIFSHSALREGWDNPNVFQICTLKYSSNDVQRHQEVGRGLRLCVNSKGDRMDSSVPNLAVHEVNKLTVIANESYEDFVNGLQKQINENLFDRPVSASKEYFIGKRIQLVDGIDGHITLNKDQAVKIYQYLAKHDYIDGNEMITDTYKNDLNSGDLKPLDGSLLHLTDGIHMLIKRLYEESLGIEIDDGNRTQIENNPLNENFKKEEFKELWKHINHRYAYTVDFDTEELIKKSIDSIDSNLLVTKLVYTVTTGFQQDEIKREQINRNDSFSTAKSRSDTIQSFASETVRYDLLGKIREKTKLTRKTLANILKGINPIQFSMFKLNPEEFISKVSKLINEQKANIIVEHVTYNKTNERPFDTTIFTQEKSKSDFLKAYKSRKNIQDYVFTDGTATKSVERKFAEELDYAEDVVVYAKLPKGFYIPTPVGNYSPDWAIAFKQGAVKHVYFVAETKGTMESMQLRKIEEAKIECAKKLFNEMSNQNIRYGKVDSFEELMNVLRF
jgi:type III restriction enzyme